MQISAELVKKYNSQAPRYTSYPTVPLWENNLDSNDWNELVKKAFQDFGEEDGISIYIHLPFCESLCTYCGCNKRITKNNNVKAPYIQALLAEWDNYKAIFAGKAKIAGIHLGGGTPTFFEPSELNLLISTILVGAEISPNAEFSFEGHPNNTSFEHLKTLKDLGFDRVSYGIQDFNELVQTTIHRIQPFEKVKNATDSARILGYTSINFDLIYGLPHQTQETMEDTFSKVLELKPDRIAFYSYAHLPSAFPAQKSFEKFLPAEKEKRELYEFGRVLLLKMGYEEIGMDHFALPNDALFIAKNEGRLHRNFMGYTTLPSKMLIGLGASSVSDIYYAYAQNEKGIEKYQSEALNANWTLQKGHKLSDLDIQIRRIILDLICKKQAEIPTEIWEKFTETQIWNLQEMEGDGLISIHNSSVKVSEEGMSFIRNICSQIDIRLAENQNKKVLFSKTI
ncbi:oxygen-independent coproporphyrinogen III oxidase [Algoriphagus sp. D3-2-R+10]|uniref:oxygen-independent coproporphyrinogen III oxidase n=1 Tax=Algoriphagus aurantiacus TaxID=3103948 RepID=UPI002B3F4E09|nr:oxygen-independent coproporphyrinogen III oxidase [Algoriphagus sp. D3-2-R+10]MEB2777308.1 oxygen-independent coproporphyrinogen III oxidase [Algoriphagus sp. D3-2-R+10]